MKCTKKPMLCLTLIAAFSMAAIMPGCDSGTSSAPAIKSDTPEAVFQSAKDAAAKKDYKKFSQCLTPESQDMMAGGLVMAGSMMKAFAGMANAFGGMGGEQDAEAKAKMEELQASMKKIDSVLEKHGVDMENMEQVNPMNPGNMEEAMGKLSASIKDKPAFIGDMMTALESLSKTGSDGESAPASPLEGFGDLIDLKIDGDTATANVTFSDGRESKPIEFKKLSSGWRIGLPMDAMN